MLSRYYNHLSHLDGIAVNPQAKYSEKYFRGAKILPLLLLFDVGNCLVRIIEHLLKENGLSVRPFVGGRTGHEYSAQKYIRIATSIMCEKHTRNNAVELGLLIKNIPGFHGDIGITDIYRGGMEVFRYGDSHIKPPIQKILEVAVFAVGNRDHRRICVEQKDSTSNGERYELRWPKEWDITGTSVGFVARQSKQEFPLFDYVSSFVNWLEGSQHATK
jgi:hypothetical protein